MSETKWTPGPWVMIEQDRSIMSPNGLQIAHTMSKPGCGMQWDKEELEANAHLIAAAPDLYAALNESRDELFSLGLSAGHALGCVRAEIEAREIHARIDAALKKARGE